MDQLQVYLEHITLNNLKVYQLKWKKVSAKIIAVLLVSIITILYIKAHILSRLI